MTTLKIELELINPHDFVHHPDNRPGGLKDDHIESLANNMRAAGFDVQYFVKYLVPDITFPASFQALIGKKVLIGGHHRVEAAKRAGLKDVPAILDQMDYGKSLEFLDKDNTYSPLHWYEKGILNEKRRALLGMTAAEYGVKILGQNNYANRRKPYSCSYERIPGLIRKLLAAKILTSELSNLSELAVQVITQIAPESGWRLVLQEVRDGTISPSHDRLRVILNARYAKTAPTTPTPNTISYLYMATSPHSNLIKCGMTRSEDPKAYIKAKTNSTWVLDYVHEFSIEVPTTMIEQADAMMRERLSKGWPGGVGEFYPITVPAAKKVLLEIAAHFADPGDSKKKIKILGYG